MYFTAAVKSAAVTATSMVPDPIFRSSVFRQVDNVKSKSAFRRAVFAGLLVFGICQSASGALIGWTPWVQFGLSGLHAGQSAVVAEQIRAFRDCVGCPTYYDYDFRVRNTSLVGLPANGSIIDGFALGVGVNAFLGGLLPEHYAFVNGGGDGFFPNIVDAPNIGFIPFLGGTPLLGGAVAATTLKVTNGWGFEEFDTRPAALTAYAVRFYAPNQAAGNGFAPLQTRRFDLFSFFGPVPGTGGVDPIGAGDFFAFDDGGILNSFPGALDTPNLIVCTTSCDPGGPPDAPAGFDAPADTLGFASIPEPGSIFLMVGGLLITLFLRRRSIRRSA